MRGEKFVYSDTDSLHLGSPPHARGKERIGDATDDETMDHPRMRGEKFEILPSNIFFTGSPPHARGKVWLYKG